MTQIAPTSVHTKWSERFGRWCHRDEERKRTKAKMGCKVSLWTLVGGVSRTDFLSSTKYIVGEGVVGCSRNCPRQHNQSKNTGRFLCNLKNIPPAVQIEKGDNPPSSPSCREILSLGARVFLWPRLTIGSREYPRDDALKMSKLACGASK